MKKIDDELDQVHCNAGKLDHRVGNLDHLTEKLNNQI
jgi:hypothetical protein